MRLTLAMLESAVRVNRDELIDALLIAEPITTDCTSTRVAIRQ